MIFRAFVTPNLLVLRSRAQLAPLKDAPTRTTDAAHRTILRDAMLRIPPQDEESGDTRERRRCLFASTFRSFCLRFGSSIFRASEELAPFRSRNAWTPFPPDLAAAEPHCAKKGTRSTGQRPEDPGKKTGRSIRCPARNSSAENSPNRFSSLWTSRRAPALHACECLTIPAFKPIPLDSPREANAAVSVGARECLSSSEKSLADKFEFLSRNIA